MPQGDCLWFFYQIRYKQTTHFNMKPRPFAPSHGSMRCIHFDPAPVMLQISDHRQSLAPSSRAWPLPAEPDPFQGPTSYPQLCWWSLIIVLAVIVGCSSFTAGLSRDKQEPPDAAAGAEAHAVLLAMRNHNANLNNFKGIGKIKVWQKGRLKIDERVAWIGSEKSKINIVVLIGGYPAVKIASDGKWFYYYEIGEGDPIYKKIAASDANLKRIISISIQTGDVLNLLAGRVPIREHDSVILKKQEAKQGYVLVLKKRWRGVSEKIYVDETKTRPRQVEFYSRSGSLIYRARFDEMQMIKGYLVPARLSISNGDDADFELDVNRYWADVEVTSSMFVLNPPD